MAIFPKLTLEKTVQVDDKTRLDATLSFTSNENAVTLVEIDPGDGTGFLDVTPAPATKTSEYLLDWVYSTDGTFTVSARITTDGAPVTETMDIEIVTAANDKLFSDDQDFDGIIELQERLKLVEKGRYSHLKYHRKAQEEILDEIDAAGIYNSDGTSITKDQIFVTNDVNNWSTYLTLHLIYMDKSNTPGDHWEMKAMKFKKRGDFYKERSFLRIDFNKDDSVSLGEFEPVRSSRMVRA